MYNNSNSLKKYKKIRIDNINDLNVVDSKVNFFIGDKKVGFRNYVIKIYYDEDIPIDNKLKADRFNRFTNKIKRNMKVSLSI
jgi:GTP cyclohydrolase III